MPDKPLIKVAGYQVPASVHNRAMRVLERELMARVGDAVDFDFMDSVITSLGKSSGDLFTMVGDGTLTMCYQSTTRISNTIPEFGLLDLPFMYRDRAHAYSVLDGPFGEYLKEKLAAETNYRMLGYWDNGFRHLSNRVHAISTPADCAGLKIRTQFSEVHQRAFRLMGFEPQAIEIRDLIPALDAGLVDAQDNALTNYYNFEIYKRHPYVSLTAHTFGSSIILANAEKLDALSKPVQDALQVAAIVATKAQREFATAEDDEMLEALAKQGITPTSLSVAQHDAFVKAVTPIHDEDRARFGDKLFDMALGR